jgi:WhiB family transcriptional regulator, redox-sensing transcriptional regulator
LSYLTSRAQLQVWGAVPSRGGTSVDDGRLAWRLEAACQHLPTELFFPIGHGPRAEAQTKLAKSICDTCSVRAECLEYALGANAQYGVFGGLAEEERREVRRRVARRYELAGGRLEESA